MSDPKKTPEREPLLSRRPFETSSHHDQRIRAILRAVRWSLERDKKKKTTTPR